jgi:hypothetical protein
VSPASRDLEKAESPNELDDLIDRANRDAVDIGEQVAYLVTGELRELTDASHPVADG